MQHVFRKKRFGFNAIGLVVVIFVVFILIGVVLVALRIQNRGRLPHSSTRAQTNNNRKQLSLACHSANGLGLAEPVRELFRG